MASAREEIARMTTDGLAEESAPDEENDEDDEPPYSKLDPETAAKCGLWQ